MFSSVQLCLTLCNPMTTACQVSLSTPTPGAAQVKERKWKVKSLSHVQTLCDPTDCSLTGSSTHGIFQARILEWVAISFSYPLSLFAGFHWSGDQNCLYKSLSMSPLTSNLQLLECYHLVALKTYRLNESTNDLFHPLKRNGVCVY